MKVLVVGFNFRNIDNFSLVLDKIIENGGDVKLILFPYLADPSYKRMSELKYDRIIERPLSCLSNASMNFKELVLVVNDSINAYNPDLIIVDDIRSYPSKSVLKALKWSFILKALKGNKFLKRPPVIVFQHGLFQLWKEYNKNFACDYLITFGESHKEKIKSKYRDRVFAAGLPKLDKLCNVITQDDKYILFIAQNDPPAKFIKKGFVDLSEQLKLPILVKPHPQHIHYYNDLASENIKILSTDTDIIKLIANSNFVITTGSTSGLEALLLKKCLIVLPSMNSSAYEKELFVTNDYTADEIIRVLNEQTRKNVQIEKFLERVIGNSNFKATDLTYEVLTQIIPDFKKRNLSFIEKIAYFIGNINR